MRIGIRSLAAALVAVGAVVAPAGSAAPAVGAVDYVQFQQLFAGTDGTRWALGGTAYAPHGPASTADSALLLWLERCRNASLWECELAGAWRVPLVAGALHVAGDDTTATLKATVGGLTLNVALAAQPAGATAASTGPNAGVTLDPTGPDFSAGQVIDWVASGTVSVGGLRCANNPFDARFRASIGTFVGTEASSGTFAAGPEGMYSSTAPPHGLNPGFLTAGHYRAACLTTRQAPPNSGYRLTARAGAVVGQFTIEKKRLALLSAQVLFIPSPSRGDAQGLLLVKRPGTHTFAVGTQTFFASGLDGIPAGGALNSTRPMQPGTYMFALWSDRGATLWFPPDTVRHLVVTRHAHVRAGTQDVATGGPTTLATTQWIAGPPLSVDANTYAITQATMIANAPYQPPADYNKSQVCFLASDGTCHGSVGPTIEEEDVGFDPRADSYLNPGPPAPLLSLVDAIGMPFYDRPPSGTYRPAVSYQGMHDKTQARFRLAYLSIAWP